MVSQINLTLPAVLQKAAKKYAKTFGFRNMQELATIALREKVMFERAEYDTELTEKEKEIIEHFINATLKNPKLLATEEELDKALS